MKSKNSKVTISIVGLGYVGLPTALAFHESGFNVFGIDVSPKVLKSLQSGFCHFVDQSSDFIIPIDSPRWSVTDDFNAAISSSDIVLITVPTPVNEDNTPDLSFIESASESVIKSINRNSRTIVVLESTVYPGVTRSILMPLCEELGVKIGEQLVVAYCPERVSPGDANRGVSSVARIIGCDDPDVGELLAEIYSNITSESSNYVGKIEVAEAAKLIENTQRDIDLAFVNELSLILPLMGLDTEEVLSAAASKWNFHRHTAGIGIGGHCIPVDPYYYISLSEKLGHPSKISPIARDINEGMPKSAFNQIKEILGNDDLSDMKLLILGYSYKPETGDLRETPVKYLSKFLSDSGADIYVWDPYIDIQNLPIWINPLEGPFSESDFDMVILATAHDVCINLEWNLLASNCRKPILFDGRRALDANSLRSLGWEYYGIGYPI